MCQHQYEVTTAMSTVVQLRSFLNEYRENQEHRDLEIFESYHHYIGGTCCTAEDYHYFW